MIDDATFDKIEAWLSGDLSPQEAAAFEAAMAADPALALEVERHRKGRDALDQLAVLARQQDIARWQTSLDDIPAPPGNGEPVKKTSRWLRFIGLYGILSLFVLVAGYWFWAHKTEDAAQQTPLETAPPQPAKETTPMANDATPIPDSAPSTSPQDNPSKTESSNRQLIALAETNLNDFRGAVLNNYKDQRGSEEDENPAFAAAVKAFQKQDAQTAMALLSQFREDDPYFSAAQEMLAALYFSGKQYGQAARCYAAFAMQSPSPEADLRLLHFYLADYARQKAAFWEKMKEMSDPANRHKFRREAQQLKVALQKMGISEQ